MVARLIRPLAVGGVALMFVATALADLPDPTAPPARVAPVSGAEAAPQHTLTAIKLSRGQKIAVIDGQEVTVGGRYGDARVVRIGKNEVVLRRGRELTVLELFPDIQKKVRRK